MVLDTSAIVAILMDEPEADIFSEMLESHAPLAVSAITFYEASIVMASKMRGSGAKLIDDFFRDLMIAVVPVDVESSIAARDAYFRFGRGYHPAGLNLADCFSYSLAKTRDEPLLFKGGDFLKTDVVPAWRP